jgi:hypothetical protein
MNGLGKNIMKTIHLIRLMVTAALAATVAVAATTQPADAPAENPATLESLDAEAPPPELRISGVVIGDHGQAIAKALIKVEGVSPRSGSQSWGDARRFVDATVESDAHGCFLIRCKSKIELVYAMVSAEGTATRPAQFQPGRDYVVRLHEGVTVTGRLMAGITPVPDAALRIQPANPVNGEFFVISDYASDSDGRFSIPHLPPEKSLALCATMDSLPDKGALSPKKFVAGKNKSTLDLGDLELQPGYRVAGRILLTDGKPAPAGTRLMLGRENVSDNAASVLDAQGRFNFPSVPAETVTLYLRSGGYKFTYRNPSLDWLNGRIIGKVEGDTTNLTIIIEKGEFRYGPNQAGMPSGADCQPRDKPLRSAKP